MIAPQDAETSAMQENYAKFRENRENSREVGKIWENLGKSGKFGKTGKIRENSGRTGEEPGTETFAEKPKILPKKNRGRTWEWGKTCPICNFIEF